MKKIILGIVLLVVANLILASSHIISLVKSNLNKVFYEYNDDGIKVSNSIRSVEERNFLVDKYSAQIMLDYEKFDDAIFEKIKANGESYRECSKRYHTVNNRKFLKELGIGEDYCFVSKYTPFIFVDYARTKSLNEVWRNAEEFSRYEFVNSIRIFKSNLYDLEIDSMEKCGNSCISSEKASVFSTPPSNIDMRINRYDNFPTGTYYKGRNIKIGILDTGVFVTNHFNFYDIVSECVYDTYHELNENEHPTWVASVLGGRYGYASLAELYYVDVNSETGYLGIERLIDKGCNIVNMSISANSCENNGEYNTGLESYLDYIYTSTRIIMVASTGNGLDKVGTGGFVALPALCANVISVGSITDEGIPSSFSNYKIKNDVGSNPNLVAVGSNRFISNAIGNLSGTSFSAPAVSGAIALFFEKNGVKELPEVLSVLSVTADDSIIDTSERVVEIFGINEDGNYVSSGKITCTNNLKGNGTRERTGAGALDVTALLNYDNYGLDGEIYVENSLSIGLRQDYFFEGQTIKISCAWQRNANVTIYNFLWWETRKSYSIEPLADFDLFLQETNGSFVAGCHSTNTNVEVITVSIRKSGNYEIRINPYSNYKNLHNLNYSYRIV